MIPAPQFRLWMWAGMNWVGWEPIRGTAYVEYLLASAVVGAIVAIIVLPIAMRLQRRADIGQQIYEDGPKAHAAKQGTPTMGGIAFPLAALAALCFARAAWLNSWQSFGLTLAVVTASAIGLSDDVIIVLRRRPLGLRARWKMLLLFVVAIVVMVFIQGAFPPDTAHTQLSAAQWWFGRFIQLSPVEFWVLAVLAIVGSANAVNLADGVDGLAASSVLPPLIVLTVLAGEGVGAGIAGALVVFFLFNRYPARIFMGDTGSLALGVLLAGLAIETHLLLWLPLLGIVFVAEALSVMLQVVSFKLTGKRIFKMSPLHHHFELSGWSERKVTFVFAAISAAASAVFCAVVYFSP